MISCCLVEWRSFKRSHSDLFFKNKRLLITIIFLFACLHQTRGLTGIEFNVDPNNIAAVNSQLKRTKNSEQQEYSAIINEEANLPCNISAPSFEDSVALILWYRAGGKNAIYTVDARYTPSLREAKHFISPALKNRVQLICDNGQSSLSSPNKLSNKLVQLNRTKRSTIKLPGPSKLVANILNTKMASKKTNSKASEFIKPQKEKRCILKIRPVQIEDGMVDYRCRVDFKRGRTINYNMYLNLIVPSKKLEIYATNSETGDLIKLNVGDSSNNVNNVKEIGPFLEDEPLNLTCVSAGGNPPPTVVWFAENDQLIDDTYERTIVAQINRVSNLLELGPLSESHHGRAYVCKVSNSDSSAAIEQTVQLKVDLKPKDLKIEPKPTVIKAREKLILTCKCSNGKKPAQLLWFKGEQAIENENLIQTELNSENELISKLTWTVSSDDNEKKLKCRAINSRFPNYTIEDTLALNVHFEPSVSLVFGSSKGTEELLESTDIFFECNVHANPSAFSVQWMFNGKLLIENSESDQLDNQSDSKKSFSFANSSLAIKLNSTSQSSLINDSHNKINYNSLQIASIQSAEQRSDQMTPTIFAAGRYDKSQNLTIGADWPFEATNSERSLSKSLRKTSRAKRKMNDVQLDKSVIQLPNVSISSRSLLIKGASDAHSGSYQCCARNTVGIGQSEITPIHVHFAPRCSDDQPIQYVLKNNQMESISCEVEADPSEVQFHWLLLTGSGELTSETVLNTAYENFHTNQSTVAPFTSFYHHFQPNTHVHSSSQLPPKDQTTNLYAPSIQFTIEHLEMNNSNLNVSTWIAGQINPTTSSKQTRIRSLAKYTPTHNSHYGILQCWASNKAGIQRQPCTFFVLAAQAPEPPVNCTTTNVTRSSLTLECIPGYSGGLPQTFHLEVYTKEAVFPISKFKQFSQDNLSNKRKVSNLREVNEMNEVLIEESNSMVTNVSTIPTTSLPAKVSIDGKSMLLLHNLTAEEYPFFSVSTLPPGNSFYLITYAKNVRGVSKKIEITANTLTAERWQTDVIVDYLERNIITTPILISIIVTCCLSIFVLTAILVLRSNCSNKTQNKNSLSSRPSNEKLPFELCLPLDNANTDLRIHSHLEYANADSCLNTFHHRMLQYSTLHHSANHLMRNNLQSNSQNCICDDRANCANCDHQLIPQQYLDSTSGEITLESFDANTTLNRRTIPVSILLPHQSSGQINQMAQTNNLMSSINSQLSTCGHLSTFVNPSSTIGNSVDQCSNTSADPTTTTNSLEQNSNANRVFFIHTSNSDSETDFIQEKKSLRSKNFHSLSTKVQITDSGSNRIQSAQEANQMLYLTNQSNDQYDYYKLLSRTPMFVSEGNYNGLELLASPYLHDQVVNLNMNGDCANEKGSNFDNELSNFELLDGKIETNHSVSLNNNKTWIVVEGKEKNQTLTSV